VISDKRLVFYFIEKDIKIKNIFPYDLLFSLSYTIKEIVNIMSK